MAIHDQQQSGEDRRALRAVVESGDTNLREIRDSSQFLRSEEHLFGRFSAS
jgi:hypothetical protein